MLFETIFGSLFVAGWLICGFLPWLAVSVATRGNAGLGMLPLCLFAGAVGGLGVPLLLNDGWVGVWLSFVAAVAVPALLMAVRKIAAPALTSEPSLPPSRKRGSLLTAHPPL
ncbi:MAG: hypothetical protein ACRDHY_19830, partial [Anaerolineales bacterium]